jgi:hypothetical protein
VLLSSAAICWEVLSEQFSINLGDEIEPVKRLVEIRQNRTLTSPFGLFTSKPRLALDSSTISSAWNSLCNADLVMCSLAKQWQECQEKSKTSLHLQFSSPKLRQKRPNRLSPNPKPTSAIDYQSEALGSIAVIGWGCGRGCLFAKRMGSLQPTRQKNYRKAEDQVVISGCMGITI